jgi:hypothetical protein
VRVLDDPLTLAWKNFILGTNEGKFYVNPNPELVE